MRYSWVCYTRIDMKEARISSLVSLFPLPQYVVVLEDKEKARLVPIWIGVNEGNAIALEMNGEKFPRPLTHDLIVSIMAEIGAKIERIVITDIKDNSYFAEIRVRMNDKTYHIDARPSDSLAIAVRIKCPIYIDAKVLDKCPAIEKPITEDEIKKFKEELKHMTPEDFFKKLEATPGKKKDTPGALGAVNMEFEEEIDEDDLDEDEDLDEEDDADDEDGPAGGDPAPPTK